jgi:hypothetical protein
MATRLILTLHVLHMFVAAAVLVQAVAHLAVNPNFERAVLLYFLPPLIALFLISINLIRGTNWTVIVLCQIFLNMIAFAVVLGELPFVLPNLKPQFPGMPPQQDRVLVFYFAAYALFLWVLLPPYLLGSALLQHYRKQPASISLITCCLGAVTWTGIMITFVALSPRLAEKLF